MIVQTFRVKKVSLLIENRMMANPMGEKCEKYEDILVVHLTTSWFDMFLFCLSLCHFYFLYVDLTIFNVTSHSKGLGAPLYEGIGARRDMCRGCLESGPPTSRFKGQGEPPRSQTQQPVERNGQP